MQDESLPLPKTFHITKGWKVFLLICPLISIIWSIGAIWILLTLNESEHATFDTIVALLSLGMASLLMWAYFDYSKSRLTLTSDGITYYSSGFCFYTSWHNVIGFRNTSQPIPMTVSWTSKLIGFKLRQSAMIHTKLEEGMHQGIAVIETDWWYPARLRDTGFFIIDEIVRERSWRQSELSLYLHHYAPQAFEELDSITQKEQLNR